MKLQSAIEFLSTYGFVFIILAIVLAVILFLATSARSNISAQCAGFSGVSCNYASFYSNLTDAYSLVTLQLSNSQSVPINITNISISYGSLSVNGFCTPSFLYPGSQATCAAEYSTYSSPGSIVRGYYKLGAKYCNNGLYTIPLANCTSPVTYSGEYFAQSTNQQAQIYSVVAAQGANTVSLGAFNSINVPFVPGNYVIIENGEWVGSGAGGATAYSYGSSAYYGHIYLGVNTVYFPSSVYQLNNKPSTSMPYNSLFSMASTTLYVYSTQNLERVYTDDGMEVYYKLTGSNTWNSIYGGSAWRTNNGGALYSANVVIAPGMYNLIVVWSNVGQDGLQALNIS